MVGVATHTELRCHRQGELGLAVMQLARAAAGDSAPQGHQRLRRSPGASAQPTHEREPELRLSLPLEADECV